jgi:hypothetical protein
LSNDFLFPCLLQDAEPGGGLFQRGPSRQCHDQSCQFTQQMVVSRRSKGAAMPRELHMRRQNEMPQCRKIGGE